MEILFKGVYGSKLYGLDHKGSDHDVRGIFMPSYEDLLFGTKQDVHVVKEEEDTTLFSIGKFFSMLQKGEAKSFEMLHTPDNLILESSPLWEDLRSLRSDVYCKDMRGIMGFIKAKTTGVVEEALRNKEAETFKRYLENLPPNLKLGKIKDELRGLSTDVFAETGLGSIWVWSSWFDGEDTIYDVLGSERFITAKTSGKELSHTLRCILQLEEMVDTGDLQFPLKDHDLLFPIKMDMVDPYQAALTINDALVRLKAKLSASDLPDRADLSRIKACILDHASSGSW